METCIKKLQLKKRQNPRIATYQVTVPITNCGVFFSGARIGSPSSPLTTMPPANITNIVDSQHDTGCFRENAWAPEEKKIQIQAIQCF